MDSDFDQYFGAAALSAYASMRQLASAAAGAPAGAAAPAAPASKAAAAAPAPGESLSSGVFVPMGPRGSGGGGGRARLSGGAVAGGPLWGPSPLAGGGTCPRQAQPTTALAAAVTWRLDSCLGDTTRTHSASRTHPVPAPSPHPHTSRHHHSHPRRHRPRRRGRCVGRPAPAGARRPLHAVPGRPGRHQNRSVQ